MHEAISDAVVAVDTGSNGAGDTIKKVREAGKPYYVHDPNAVDVNVDEEIPF